MSDQERLDRLEAEGLKMHTPEFERDIAETMTEGRMTFEEARRRCWRSGWMLRFVLEHRDGRRAFADDWRTLTELALDAAKARDREATK